MVLSFRRDPAAALRRFGRQQRGYLDQLRLEELDRALCRSGPSAVTATSWARGGNRAFIRLADGTRLRLSLFWPGRGELASVARVSFDDDVGWVVVALRPGGEVVRLYAFRIQVDVPVGESAPSTSRPA